MSDAFNPYSEWLDIPIEQQPPDYYALLGISRFESRPDVIRAAADERISRLHKLQLSRDAALALDLMDRVAEAQLCLCNPDKKGQYDAQLARSRLALDSQPSPTDLPPRLAPPVVPPDLPPRFEAPAVAPPDLPPRIEPPIIAVKTSPPKPRTARDLPQRRLIALGAVAVFLLMAIVVALSSRKPEPLSRAPRRARAPAPVLVDESPLSSAAVPSPEQRTKTKPTNPGVPTSESVPSKSSAEAEPKVGSGNTVPQGPSSAATTQMSPSMEAQSGAKPSIGSPPPPSGMMSQDSPTAPSDAKMALDEKSKPKPPEAKKPAGAAKEVAKEPVPDKEAQAKAAEKVRSEGRLGWEDGATLEIRRNQAETLLQASTANTDSVERFVLMRRAWEIMADIGELSRSFEIIEQMGRLYEAVVITFKADALGRYWKIVGIGSQARAPSTRAAEAAMELAQGALRDDLYDLAASLLDDVAKPAANKTKDNKLIADTRRLRTDVSRRKEQFGEVVKARAVLAEDANNGAANLTVGLWLCLARGEWEKGLVFLTKGNNAPLAELATRDLALPSTAAAKLEMADAWWKAGDGPDFKDKAYASSVRSRAAHWYQLALPSLSGMDRERAEKRLAETTLSGDVAQAYALEFDGRQSYVVVPFFYDGSVPITMEAIVKPAADGAGGVGRTSDGTVIGNLQGYDRGGLSLSRDTGRWCLSFVEVRRLSPLSFGDTTQTHSMREDSSPPNKSQTDESWTHLAGVFDGRQLRLFVNGQLKRTTSISGRHQPATRSPLVIGARPSGSPDARGDVMTSQHFRGLVKVVRISNTARYAVEFKSPGQLDRDSSTRLLLRFDKGTGDQVEDSSGQKTLVPTGKGGRKKPTALAARLYQTNWAKIEPSEGLAKPSAE